MVDNGSHLREMFLNILTNYAPGAIANIEGNTGYSYLHGNAYFYSVPMGGVLVEVEVFGLPDAADKGYAFYGMHLSMEIVQNLLIKAEVIIIQWNNYTQIMREIFHHF